VKSPATFSFLATTGVEIVAASNSLEALLKWLAESQEPPPCMESVAVWHGGVCVVVRAADGTLTWLSPSYIAPTVVSN
jgi:hypothetical protein